MPGRSGSLLVCALWLGCTPAADAPVPAAPPSDPQVMIDHAGNEDIAEPVPAPRSPAAPQAVPVQINERYAEQTDPEHWVARFEREGREVFDHRDQIIEALGLRPGLRIADVGAGTGLFTLALAKTVGPEGRVYAVDVQAYFLDHISHRAREEGLDNVQVVRARQGSVALPEASVDLVLMCDAYHHVEQPAAYLESLRTAIKPGGRLVIVDYRAVEGHSNAWVLEHVRATPQRFRAEIEGAGFRFLREHEGMLEDNFFYEFERP